jgi:hypothetical protein
MKRGYKLRPEDFKRRILSRVYTNKKDLLEEEYKWLFKIKKEELGIKYYNLHNHHFNHWSANDNINLTVGQKISASPNRAANISKANKGKIMSEETKEKLRQANLGKKYSAETNKKKGQNSRDYSDPVFLSKMSNAAKNRSVETRKKLSDSARRLFSEGKSNLNRRRINTKK